MTLTEFLLARIAEDEAWANASVATPGATHWHWVNSDTDEPVTPDPFTQSGITDDGAVSLRTIEELSPVSWEGGAPLPDFVIWSVDDLLTPGVAGHIARHDPARVLAECDAKRRIVERATMNLGRDSIRDRILGPSIEASWKAAMVSVLYQLASVYADHPDYDEAWRP